MVGYSRWGGALLTLVLSERTIRLIQCSGVKARALLCSMLFDKEKQRKVYGQMCKQDQGALSTHLEESNVQVFSTAYKKLCIKHHLFLCSDSEYHCIEIVDIPNMDFHHWDDDNVHIEWDHDRWYEWRKANGYSVDHIRLQGNGQTTKAPWPGWGTE